MRREYGSRLPRLIDAPTNRDTLLDIYAATAEALARWEPRFTLTSVQATSAAPGRVQLDLTGVHKPDGQTITIQGVVIQ
jgi:phage baseplate assembly protein W